MRAFCRRINAEFVVLVLMPKGGLLLSTDLQQRAGNPPPSKSRQWRAGFDTAPALEC